MALTLVYILPYSPFLASTVYVKLFAAVDFISPIFQVIVVVPSLFSIAVATDGSVPSLIWNPTGTISVTIASVATLVKSFTILLNASFNPA